MIANFSQYSLLHRRKYALIVLGIATGLALLLYVVYWVSISIHSQKTDDAYVVGNQVPITPQVTGRVIAINADNTDLVHAGDILIRLDPIDAEQALERTKIALANSVRQTRSRQVMQKQLAANVALHRTELHHAERELKRRIPLYKKGAINQEAFQNSAQEVERARIALQMMTEQLNANQALLMNTPLDQQPEILQAATQLRQAWLTLQRTRIVSPVTGYVARRNVQIGTQVQPSTPLMVVIPLAQLWVDANFKETQLKNIQIGQPALVATDLYGSRVQYSGTVTGVYASTGSGLSLLPVQNATGNWIKVVQRVPVRISLASQQLKQYPLRIGLSATVMINTADRKSPLQPSKIQDLAAYPLPLPLDLTPVNQLIAEIIQANVEWI